MSWESHAKSRYALYYELLDLYNKYRPVTACFVRDTKDKWVPVEIVKPLIVNTTHNNQMAKQIAKAKEILNEPDPHAEKNKEKLYQLKKLFLVDGEMKK